MARAPMLIVSRRDVGFPCSMACSGRTYRPNSGRTMMRKVEIISRKRVLDDFFKVDEAYLRFERFDGKMSETVRRLNFERGDSVAALLVDVAQKTVRLTEQFKYPTYEKVGGWTVEVVAGMIDGEESPEQAIRREILEEAGFEAERLEPIASFFVSPGGSSERIILFCAAVSERSRRSAGGGVASEHEDIRIVEWPLADFLKKIQTGQLQDAKTLVAGYWLKDNLARIVGD
jgi:nudix-type nucleoside diphosphatase (YffH/AdpP family)